jgi:hypothetical protein
MIERSTPIRGIVWVVATAEGVSIERMPGSCLEHHPKGGDVFPLSDTDRMPSAW